MQVKQIMTPAVETVGLDATIREAARKMAEHNVGCLPVIHEEAGVGIVTDRDITVRAVARDLDPDAHTVGEIMTRGIAGSGEVETEKSSGTESISQEADVEEAVRVMQEKNIRRLLVHDSEYRLVKVISLADVSAAVSEPSSK